MISVCLIGLDNSGKSCLIAPHSIKKINSTIISPTAVKFLF